MNVEQLRQEYVQVRDKAHDLRRRLDDMEDLENLPKLREAYEGKFFKFKNSYGVGYKTPDWWLYSNVRKINDDKTAVVVKFESNKDASKFEIDYSDNFYEMEKIEISQQEYLIALRIFLKELDKETTFNEEV